MWNPFSWVKRLFVNSDKLIQQIVSKIKTFIQVAAPIVAKLQEIEKSLPQSEFVKKVEAVLAEYVRDSAVVSGFLQSVSGFTSNQILKQAALTALKVVAPSVSENYASIAIELALAVIKLKTA